MGSRCAVRSCQQSASTLLTRRGCSRKLALAPVGILCYCAPGCGASRDSRAAGRRPVPTRRDDAPLLLPDVNLGVIPRGGKRELIARLINATDKSIHWAALRTSCDCLSVIAAKNSLEPSDDVLAKISYDGGA